MFLFYLNIFYTFLCLHFIFIYLFIYIFFIFIFIFIFLFFFIYFYFFIIKSNYYYYYFSDRKKDWYPDRFTCIPIGLSQWHDHLINIERVFKEKIGFENEQSLTPNNIDSQKDIFILSNFNTDTHHSRKEILTFFRENFGGKVNCFFDKVTNDQHIFYNLRSKFVVSPRGAGIDCYRNYESIFMNAIPIILSSTLDVIFEDLPVLIVDSYFNLNVSFLEEQFDLIRNRKDYNYEKLYVGYWKNLVQNKIKEYNSEIK